MTAKQTSSSIDPKKLAKAKSEYIYGTINDEGVIVFLSYDKIAKELDISSSALKRVGGPDKWTAKRKAYRTKTDLKTIEKKSEITAAEIVQSDDKFQLTGELGREVGHLKLEKMKEKLEDGGEVSGFDFKNTIDGIKNSQDIIKVSQGEVIPQTLIDQRSIELNILNGDFCDQELEFMKQLIKK